MAVAEWKAVGARVVDHGDAGATHSGAVRLVLLLLLSVQCKLRLPPYLDNGAADARWLRGGRLHDGDVVCSIWIVTCKLI